MMDNFDEKYNNSPSGFLELIWQRIVLTNKNRNEKLKRLTSKIS
jgi:hypothetical protein